VKKDVGLNILYVSHGYDPDTAYQKDFKVHGFHSLVPQAGQSPNIIGLPQEITFKIRHTPDYLPATLEKTGDTSFVVHAKERIHGVAPGQFCVVYDKEHHRCLGSGEITL
jgi:tRNA-specific 2-thiouridylase